MAFCGKHPDPAANLWGVMRIENPQNAKQEGQLLTTLSLGLTLFFLSFLVSTFYLRSPALTLTFPEHSSTLYKFCISHLSQAATAYKQSQRQRPNKYVRQKKVKSWSYAVLMRQLNGVILFGNLGFHSICLINLEPGIKSLCSLTFENTFLSLYVSSPQLRCYAWIAWIWIFEQNTVF